MRAIWLLTLLAILAVPSPGGAVNPGEMLEDPAQEARAREIGKHLRCLVCQNESIDESNAELARDLRILVRERIRAGESNQEVIDYVVSRYGDFVLLKPPFKPKTYLLWFGPAIILVLGAVAMVMYLRRRAAQPSAPSPLSADERRRLGHLIDEDER